MANLAPKAHSRWRVAIVDDHERSRAAVRAAVWAAGGEVAGEAARCVDAIPMVTRAHPDVAIVAVGLPDGDGVATAGEITQSAGLSGGAAHQPYAATISWPGCRRPA